MRKILVPSPKTEKLLEAELRKLRNELETIKIRTASGTLREAQDCPQGRGLVAGIAMLETMRKRARMPIFEPRNMSEKEAIRISNSQI